MKDDELREIIAGHGGSLDGTADRPKLQQRAQEVVDSWDEDILSDDDTL